MLTVYTFVFSVIFKARWGANDSSRLEFAVILFIGLIVYNVLADAMLRSPMLIVSNANFVKKIKFPTEILPIVIVLASLFHMLISLFVWLLAYSLFFGFPHLTIIYLPIILIPLCLFTLGISWFLSSLGVFLRDLGQITGLLTTILMFLSPIFYPLSALPTAFQTILQLNPLTIIIEQARNVLMWGIPPAWLELLIITLCSLFIAACGYVWFRKTAQGFADVL